MISRVTFIGSNTSPEKCPEPILPEYAFIGRSNVGKSSLINMLANRQNIARTSVQPGKTQTINHYLVDNSWYMVDLPGYGYAKVSKKSREKWLDFSTGYLESRKNLMTLFILIDSRLEPQPIDLEFIDLAGEMSLPIALVYTKTDKLKQGELPKKIARIEQALHETWESIPLSFKVSSRTKTGRDELLGYIHTTNKLFRKQ